MHNAKKYIPAGKQKQYKYFWNKDLQQLKLNRDNVRIKEENTKDPKDVQKWRQATSSTKKVSSKQN